ncbi:MAG: hypothetical protein K0R38_5733 [Polyangiaceae bacterium]|nr:hypothetical protein [Polyangiaceae bacterium]
MKASTTSLSPLTTLNTPGGSPASVNSSASRSARDGTRSDGFITNVLPQAIATGAIHSGIMAGKLKGPTPVQTPSGWRNEKLSTPRATPSENSPLRSCGIPAANSTTSMPRVTEPRASSSTLPCSAVTSPASSSKCRSMSDLSANMTRARRSAGVADQLPKAAAAAVTACATSALVERGTSLTGMPRAGS